MSCVATQRPSCSRRPQAAQETKFVGSYKHYYSYGETSYRAGNNIEEVSHKRYRYTGKEKDEEKAKIASELYRKEGFTKSAVQEVLKPQPDEMGMWVKKHEPFIRTLFGQKTK